jgi:hypothetical protein
MVSKMNKQELLKLMRLLSALESILLYAPTVNTRIPDYLLENLSECTEVLEKEILK